MKNLKLIKSYENVDYVFAEDGTKTGTDVRNAKFRIVDADSNAEIGSADVHQHGLNVSINNAGGVAENVTVLESMFANLNDE